MSRPYWNGLSGWPNVSDSGGPYLGEWALRTSGYSPIGIAAIVTIGAGYACFVTFIMRQVTRGVRLWSEMDLAARIHAHLVPPIALRAGGYDVAGRSDASSTMGGAKGTMTLL